MNERLRLQYLDALGVVQYVARMPLPGACQSPEIDWSLPEMPAAPAITSADTIGGADANSAATHASTTRATTTSTAATSAATTSPLERPAVTSEARSAVASGARAALAAFDGQPPAGTAAPSPAMTTSATAPPDTSAANHDNSTQPFQCQVVMWTVDDLLILADIRQLHTAQTNLLRDIVLALKRSGTLSAPLPFNWPLPQSARQPAQRAHSGLPSARDHFQGLLDGGVLARGTVRDILLFGEAAQQLLRPDSSVDASGTLTAWRYGDSPVSCLPGLQPMLDEPQLKAVAWRALQPLVRHPG